jgi:O-antigen/teichoic acid export membrane protein
MAGIFFFQKDIGYFLIICAASLVMAVSNLLGKLIYSYGRMRAYTFYKISMPALRIVLLISLFALFKEKGIILAIIGLNIIMCLGLGVFTWNLLPRAYDKKAKIALKEYFGFSIFAYLSFFFILLVDRMTMVFSKHYIADMKIIGFLGFSILVCLTTIKQVIGGITESVLPYIVKFKALDISDTFNRSLEYSWKYTNIILFPLVFGILVLAGPGIEFIVGKEYLPSVRLIFLLLPAVVFYSWIAIQQNELFARGRAGHLFFINLAGFLVFCVCAVFLIRNFGVEGSCVSILITSFIVFLLTVIFSVQRKKIFFYYGSPTLKPLIASLIMAGWLSLFNVSSIWSLLWAGLSGIAVYVIVMLIIKGITRGDMKRISEALFAPSQ